MSCGLGASPQEHIPISQLYFCSRAISLFPEDSVGKSTLDGTLHLMSLHEFYSAVGFPVVYTCFVEHVDYVLY